MPGTHWNSDDFCNSPSRLIKSTDLKNGGKLIRSNVEWLVDPRQSIQKGLEHRGALLHARQEGTHICFWGN